MCPIVIAAGRHEVLVDASSKDIKAGLADDPAVFYPRLATMLVNVFTGRR